MSRKSLTTFGGHPVPEPFTPEQVALAEQLARELFATATVPVLGDAVKSRHSLDHQPQSGMSEQRRRHEQSHQRSELEVDDLIHRFCARGVKPAPSA